MRWFWALHSPQQARNPTHLKPSGHAGNGKGRVSGELEAVARVGGTGRGGAVNLGETRRWEFVTQGCSQPLQGDLEPRFGGAFL
jgi:hypothetical protein